MTIHIRLAHLGDPSLEERGRALLSATERDRVERYRHEPSRHAFVVARGVVRTLLSELSPRVAPAQWRFDKGVRGKPFAPGGPAFNLSHTDGLVVVAASLRPCALGVDVEATDRTSDLDKLAQRYFSAFEAAAWMKRPVDERRARFFDLWTLKESYMKATGAGFALGLSSFRFDLDRQPMGFDVDPGVDDDPNRWAFRCWALGRHRVSLCVDGEADVRWSRENESAGGEAPTLRHAR